jgi:hypothetical protein
LDSTEVDAAYFKSGMQSIRPAPLHCSFSMRCHHPEWDGKLNKVFEGGVGCCAILEIGRQQWRSQRGRDRNQYVRTGLQTCPAGMQHYPDGSGEAVLTKSFLAKKTRIRT